MLRSPMGLDHDNASCGDDELCVCSEECTDMEMTGLSWIEQDWTQRRCRVWPRPPAGLMLRSTMGLDYDDAGSGDDRPTFLQ